MSDDAFKELLRSPLEEPRKSARESRRASRRPSGDGGGDGSSWVPVLLAMVIGGVLVIAGWLAAGSDDDDATAETTTTTTTLAAATGSVFPATYTAIDDRLAVRAERILQRGDLTYVSFSTVVAAGLEPDETAGIVGGLWELVLRDGTTVASIEDFFDPLARGTFSVAFPGVDATALDRVQLVGNAIRTSNGFETRHDFDAGLPFTADDPTDLGLEEGLTLTIDSFDLAESGSRITWHLEGAPEVTASVSAFVETLDGSGRIPGDTLFESQASGFRRNFGTTIAPPPARREGEIGLQPMILGNPATTYSATAFWTVTWVTYVDTSVDVPLEDVPVQTSGG
ncbi:MAG: hypothetical protein HKN93_00435 [Acidimicrobiia bacterium]|nr:hypothetical protein [Acidimicrobiia bacterium]